MMRQYRSSLATCALMGCASLCCQPALAQDIIPPKAYATTPGGINVADGSFTYSVVDSSIGPLIFERHHVTGTKKPNDLQFGKHMTHNFDIYVATNLKYSGSVPSHRLPVVHLGRSASGTYIQSPLSSINEHNLDARMGFLEWSGSDSFSTGNYVYTDKSGAIYTFSRTVSAQGVPFDSQRVAKIVFADGRVQTFSYNGGGQLRMLDDTSGYALIFTYDATGDIATACGFNRAQTYVTSASTCTGATLKTSYAYSNAQLTSVVDAVGQTTTYTNGVAGIMCVKPPGYSTCKLAMTYVNDKVTSQTLHDGAVWQLSGWDPMALNDPDAPVPYDGHNEVTLTDPAGKLIEMTFSKTSPFTMRDPLNRLTQYRFEGARYFDYSGPPVHDGSSLIEAILPEANGYLAVHNGPYRSITRQTSVAKPGSGLADLIEEFGYGNCFSGGSTRQNCAKPLWARDAKGNQTDFTYAAHGGVLSEMKPAPTSGAARPLKLASWVQKYAYIKNSSGVLVAAATPVWLIASETQCQTVAGSAVPSCDAAAQQRVTLYEYGPNGTANNLRARGVVVTADGVSRRTCLGYDNQGNKIFETSPRAGLAVCS